MNILLVDSGVSPGSGSQAPLIIDGLARALHDGGAKVALTTTTSGNGLLKTEVVRYDDRGLPVIAITTDETVPRPRAYDDVQLRHRFGQVLDAVRPDVVLFHNITLHGLEVVEWARNKGVPAAVLMHDSWWLCERHTMLRSTGRGCGQDSLRLDVCATCVADVPGQRRNHRRAVSAANSCGAVMTSNNWWFDLALSAGIESGRLRMTPSDQPVAAAAEGPVVPGCLRLGYAGGTTEAQGYSALVAALRRIRRSDYELHVIDPSGHGDHPGSANRLLWPVSGYVIAGPSTSAKGSTASSATSMFLSTRVWVQ